MSFISTPILDKMKTFYETTAVPERFSEYLKMLHQGSKDLKMPIGGYNPMAKEHIHSKINELILLDAEKIARDVLYDFNQDFDTNGHGTIEVVLNLADDLKGGWTNRYTTDYDSKFKLSALLERKFCSPFFWTSEEFSKKLIRNRIYEYVLRTHYALIHGTAKTLVEHMNQEIFVATHSEHSGHVKHNIDTDDYLKTHETERGYSLIFNFLYGDDISSSLNYPTFGLPAFGGFQLARSIAIKLDRNTDKR